MTHPVIRLPAKPLYPPRPITHCSWRLKTFIERDAYSVYDYAAGLARVQDNLIHEYHITAINSFWGMRARSSKNAWKQFIEVDLPELADIPPELDLIEGAPDDVEPAIAVLCQLVQRIAAVRGITEMAASKVLHLLRPRFVCIADAYVKDCLGIWGPTPAARLSGIQFAIRQLGRENQEALDQLTAMVHSIGNVTVLRGPFAGQILPVQLSRTRILDILIWAEVAIHGTQPHPDWSTWYAEECPSEGSLPTSST